MGYLPGFATPRVVCDVPYAGKLWVHQVSAYNTELGISTWKKRYLTQIEMGDAEAKDRAYFYYDPISSLPKSGQHWWQEKHGNITQNSA